MRGCRLVSCIDASFLKTFLRGTLILAVAIDGDSKMFSLGLCSNRGREP